MKNFFRLKHWALTLAILASPFILRAQDVGVTAILSPVSGDCPNSSASARIVIYNYGASAVSSIPVKVSFSGASSSSGSVTYSKSLASGAHDTVTITGLNTSAGGRIRINAATALSTDTKTSNDAMTSIADISYGTPNTITAGDSVMCGTGYSIINIPQPRGVITGWFDNATTNTLNDTGNRVAEIISASKTYYAQSYGLQLDSCPLSSAPNPASSYNAYGYAFNVVAKVTSILDSIQVYFYSTSSDSLEIWFREGGSSGYERSAGDWTMLKQDYLKGKGSASPVSIKIPATLLKGGKTYGFYFWTKNRSLGLSNDGSSYGSDSGVSRSLNSKPGVYITGSTKWGSFSSGSYLLKGNFFYRTFSATCVSNRKKIYRRVKTGSTGATFHVGSPFNGLYNGGSTQNPDNVCPMDTATYEFLPPSAYQTMDYGSKWIIVQTKVTTSGGQVINDTMTTLPTATTNYKLRIIPSNKYQDSTLIAAITVVTWDTCMNTFYRVLKVGGLPVALFGYTPTCEGLETIFKDSSLVRGGGTISRIWDFGDGGSGSSKFVGHVYQKPGNYTVTLKVITASNCVDKTTKSIIVYTKPKADFTSTPLCAGATVTFRDTTNTQGTIVSYYWQFPDGSRSTQANPVYKFKTPGNYKITYGVEVSTGCQDTITKTVTVLANPDPGIAFRSACVGEVTQFSDTNLADKGMNYLWDFGDGGTSTLASPTHIYFVGGTFKVKVTVQSGNNGCIGEATLNASPYAYPKARFSYVPACAGQDMQFTDTSDYANATPSATIWNFGDKTPPVSKGTPTHKYANPGTYNVTLYIRNTNGCADSITKTVTVDALPVADFTADSTCAGSPMQFINKSTGGSSLAYIWDFGDTTTSTDKNPKHAFASPGAYTVTLKAISGKCNSVKTQTVGVTPGPDASFRFSHIATRVTLVANNRSASNYRWIFTDLGDTLEGATKYQIAERVPNSSGTYNVCLTVTDAKGCSTTNCRTIDLTTGISDPQENRYEVKVFPNPFTGITNVSYTLLKRSLTRVVLQDMSGKEVQVVKTSGMEAEGLHSLKVDGSNLSSGVYILKIIVGDDVYNERIDKLR